ncbi:MAG TPA: zinc-binding dehydrogenase [Candidatus Limnocylindrales bacterium]|jgi:threonine dehydrogenase-like Zn-dependent dehydrogenase|nr:zinc-binding dehydrogenase [Candidatus Limnocylindrales bacterium]
MTDLAALEAAGVVTGAYKRYRAAGEDIPHKTLAWNVYGKDIERVGRDGRPELVDVPEPRADQLLIRVDAVGLCFSDVKLIRLGGDHPKLYGRDLTVEPTRIGHETSVTVMRVGTALADRFRPGQRLAIQPDIYVDGRSTAYGYTIPGGLIGYHAIGPEVLAADDGAYVVPVDDRMGYAETALTEPWACVEAAYTQRRRLWPLAGGRAWIIGHHDDARAYQFGDLLAATAEIVLSDAGPRLERAVRAAAPGVTISSAPLDAASGPFDDVMALGVRSAATIARGADALAFRGAMAIVGDEPLDGPVEIDVGRIHYHYTAYLGTTGTDVTAAYGEDRNRAEIRPGGFTVVVGAAGPMGQMHIERALRMADGPRLVLGVDLDPDRLEAARTKLEPVATELGRQLVLQPLAREPDALRATVAGLTDDRGADDIIVTAPAAAAVRDASTALAPGGMLVLFAGVPVGTRVDLDMSPVFLEGVQYTGTSGSRIADQALVVEKTVAGGLAPERALGAVGGMEAAQESLRALVEGRFAGKIVIFPHLSDLPLTSLADLASREPTVGAALGPGGAWTTEAEAALFARHLRSMSGP